MSISECGLSSSTTLTIISVPVENLVVLIFVSFSNSTKGWLINMKNRKPKVAFICVHNSCRSQIAEALGKLLAHDIFESYSAGTEVKPQINQDAVRIIKERYHIDMEKTQYSKLLNDIPEVDIVITMGCNVDCPFLPCRYREDWGLDDPTGKSDDDFNEIIDHIYTKINELISRIKKDFELPQR